MSNRSQFSLPLSAIIGQEQLKLGLILNTINNRIGGLLIRGPKGTGKTSAARIVSKIVNCESTSKTSRGDDLIEPWLQGDYFSLLWTRGQIESNRVAELTLKPRV